MKIAELHVRLATQLGPVEKITLENPNSSHFQVFLGYLKHENEWIKILNEPSESLLQYQSRKNFPLPVRMILKGTPRLAIFDDTARLDYLIEKEMSLGRIVPEEILMAFFAGVQTLLKRDISVNLTPGSILVDAAGIHFLGMGHKPASPPFLLRWMLTLMTSDVRFLRARNLNGLFNSWEGRLPKEWLGEENVGLSFPRQFDLVSEEIDATNETVTFPLSDTTDPLLKTLHIPYGEWGARAGLFILRKSPRGLSEESIDLLLGISRYWSPDILAWAFKQSFPLPRLDLYLEIARRKEFPTSEQFLAHLAPFIHGELLGSPGVQEKRAVFYRVKEFISKNYEIETPEKTFLETPSSQALNTLNFDLRLRYLPLLGLVTSDADSKPDITILVLNILVETVLYLEKGYSAWVWNQIRAIIPRLSDPGAAMSTIVRKLLEDLREAVRSQLTHISLEIVESLASLIVYQYTWVLNSPVIHAMGEMFDLLKRHYMSRLNTRPAPLLELAEVFLQYQSSTTDQTWLTLGERWIQNYPDHQLASTITAFLTKMKKII